MTETKYPVSKYRMSYDPEFHPKHKKPWTVEEIIYLCTSWDGMKKADISLALGRTHGTVLTKAHELRENGQFDYFKKLAN